MDAIGCCLHTSAAYSVPNGLLAGSTTFVPWDVEIWKQGVTHSTVTNPSQITIVTPGIYRISAFVSLPSGAFTGGVGAQLWIDGATSAFVDYNNQGTLGNNYPPCVGFYSIKGRLVAGSVIQIAVAQRSGAAMNFSNGDFAMARLGD